MGDPPRAVTKNEATRERPRALDLFCCAGGSTRGLQLAGYRVTGVDNRPQPHYCGDEFVQMDALALLDRLPHWERAFDVVFASPPCQDHSSLASVTGGNGTGWMLEATLERLRVLDVPWVCENVVGAPLARADTLFGEHGLLLCGTMFGLGVLRHRLFETSVSIVAPEHRPHVGSFYSPAGHGDPNWRKRAGDPRFRGEGYARRCAEAMQIDWMTRDELSQAIPPAYTRFIGEQLLSAIRTAV